MTFLELLYDLLKPTLKKKTHDFLTIQKVILNSPGRLNLPQHTLDACVMSMEGAFFSPRNRTFNNLCKTLEAIRNWVF